MRHARARTPATLKCSDDFGNGAWQPTERDANDVTFVDNSAAAAWLFKDEASVLHGLLTLQRDVRYLLVYDGASNTRPRLTFTTDLTQRLDIDILESCERHECRALRGGTIMSTIKITIDIDDEQIMDAVFYDLWGDVSGCWISSYAYQGFDKTPIVDVTHLDSSEEMVVTSVTPQMLASGLKCLLDNNYRHCNEPVTADLDEWDACVTDMVLQAAIFGTVIFG